MANASTVKMIAPIVTIAGTWVVSKGLQASYRAMTGNEPPRASDPETSLRTAIMWAAATAVAVAMVNVMIERWAADSEAAPELAI
ncbi:MAG: DUF4235 domain-containing protein [Actinobacteria bacterium]|nr:DUF4235 domain-containing protein [Actinomycetota bacterium]